LIPGGRNDDWIVEEWKIREGLRSPITKRQMELRDVYNSDIIMPTPEGLTDEQRPAVANLIQQGLDQISMRVASVMPQLFFPPLHEDQKTSVQRAENRRNAVLGWYEDQRMRLKLRRRARWLMGYASAPVVIRPDSVSGGPAWELRDPLKTFPAPSMDPDEITPPDCIFAFKRSRQYLEQRYPDKMARLAKHKESGSFTLLEYMDAQERVLLVVGDTPSPYDEASNGDPVARLVEVENRTGMCWAVCPQRINLDRPQSQFDGIIGMYVYQAALQALNLMAIKRGVFPETWFIYPADREGRVITPADAEQGIVGEVQGADVKLIQPQPGVYTNPALDRIEYAERQTAGIPAEFGGASGSNIRTGRRGDAVMSATVDFHVQEAQEIFEHSLRAENVRAMSIAKTYFGNTKKSFYMTTKPFTGRVQYTPDEDFETDQHAVSYAYAGADENALNIAGGQLVGLRALSRRSFMEIHPLVKDPELEHDRIVADAIEEAGMASILQLASQPDGPYQPLQLAKLAKNIKSNKLEWFEAVEELNREIQEQQAEQAGADPEQMPGMEQPGAPGVPAGPPPGPSVGDMTKRLGEMRLGQMAGAAERRGVRPGMSPGAA
jgi:hypothetical protein